METLNHLLGTCGEFHPNLFTGLLMLFGLYLVNKYKLNSQK